MCNPTVITPSATLVSPPVKRVKRLIFPFTEITIGIPKSSFPFIENGRSTTPKPTTYTPLPRHNIVSNNDQVTSIFGITSGCHSGLVRLPRKDTFNELWYFHSRSVFWHNLLLLSVTGLETRRGLQPSSILFTVVTLSWVSCSLRTSLPIFLWGRSPSTVDFVLVYSRSIQCTSLFHVSRYFSSNLNLEWLL